MKLHVTSIAEQQSQSKKEALRFPGGCTFESALGSIGEGYSLKQESPSRCVKKLRMEDKVKRLLILPVMIISLSFISLAEAAKWVNYGTDRMSDGYYDAESMTYPAKDIVRVWEKTIYSTEGRKFLEKDLGIKGAVSESRDLVDLNCRTREFRITNVISFNSSGNMVSDSNDKDSGWKAIPPESIIEFLYKEVCKQGKP
jgi:hypothetical protein